MTQLNDLIAQLGDIENREEFCEALEDLILRFKEKNMRGYVYVVYVGSNLYKIGKTVSLERRLKELDEFRIVRMIKAENITQVETKLHNKFSSKRVSRGQELFRLDDEDILYLHQTPDEWEDNHIQLF